MEKKRFTEEQIIAILKEADTGMAVTELCRKHGMSNPTFYKARKVRRNGRAVSQDYNTARPHSSLGNFNSS